MPSDKNDYTTEPGVQLQLHENRMFRVYYNGNYHYIEFCHANDCAVIIPRFSNGDFLMVRLQRAPAFGVCLEFPRGGIKPKEPWAKGACRELREETGFPSNPEDAMLLGSFGADTATINGSSHVYLVDLPDGVEPGKYDEEEIDEVVRVTPAELKAMVKDHRICDGHTLSAYAMLLAWT